MPGTTTLPLQKEQGTVPEGTVQERRTTYATTEELWTGGWKA